MKIYSSYLDPDGVLNAKDANYRLLKKLTQLTNRGLRVQELIRNNNIHSQQVTAEGRRALTNLSDELRTAEEAINEFMPKTTADEDRVGYDKLELGAVLVQDGFHGYDLMMKTRDFLEQTTRENLKGVVDANFMQVFQYYSTALDIFIQVMEDLGLFNIMKQCVDVVYKGKKRAEPKPPRPPPEDIEKEFTRRIKSDGPDEKGKKGSKDSGDKEDGQVSVAKIGSKKSGSKSAGDIQNAHDGFRKPKGRPMGQPSDEGNPEEPPPEEEEKEEEDGEGDAEFIIYFDPKTNALGMIERSACAGRSGKSTFLVDLSKEGTDAYNGVIEDEAEKKELIWLLKKLEKTKPAEVSWLDEIKKEKGVKGKKPGRSDKASKSTGSRSHSKKQEVNTKSRVDANPNMPQGPGFRNPFGAGSSSSKPNRKKTVENYQGKYKQQAAKPESGGWKKIG